MPGGPEKTESITSVVREAARARSEARTIARPRSIRFHEHLARTSADGPVAFDAFLREQNKELRAAAARRDWCPPGAGRVIDIYG
jgi:hypothetical protein